MPRAEFEIASPYDFSLSLAFSHDCRFEENADNQSLRRMLLIDKTPVLIKIRCIEKAGSQTGMVNWKVAEGLKVPRDKVVSIARHILCADLDLNRFYKQAKKDCHLSGTINNSIGLKPVLYSSVFESAAWAIMGQQVTVVFASIMKKRLEQKYGNRISQDGHSYQLFPQPERFKRVRVEHLRKLQFSRQKAEYLLGLSRCINENEIDLDSLKDYDYNEAVNRLLAIRGIGPWSANYILMRGAGHLNCLPVGDTGLNRALRENYGLKRNPDNDTATKLAAPFEPYRSLFTLYMWKSLSKGDKL